MSSRSRSRSQNRQETLQSDEYGHQILAEPRHVVLANSHSEGQECAACIAASRSHIPPATFPPLPQQAGQPPTYAYGILIEPEYKRKVTPSKEGRQGAGSFAASRFQNTAEVRERLRPRAKQPRLKCHETSATSSDPPGPGALRRSGKFYYPRESQSSATRVQEPAWPASSQKNRVEDSQSGFKKRPRVRDASPGGKYQEVPNRR